MHNIIQLNVITKSMRALWLVNQLWFIVPVNSWKNRVSSELLCKSNRPQVSTVYRLINHLGCWKNTRRIRKSRAEGRSRQLFFRILTAHDCARKFTCHVMHRAREPSIKMNNDRADGHCYSFDWIQRYWTFGDPHFSFQKQILFTIISTLLKNEQKINVGS